MPRRGHLLCGGYSVHVGSKWRLVWFAVRPSVLPWFSFSIVRVRRFVFTCNEEIRSELWCKYLLCSTYTYFVDKFLRFIIHWDFHNIFQYSAYEAVWWAGYTATLVIEQINFIIRISWTFVKSCINAAAIYGTFRYHIDITNDRVNDTFCAVLWLYNLTFNQSTGQSIN